MVILLTLQARTDLDSCYFHLEELGIYQKGYLLYGQYNFVSFQERIHEELKKSKSNDKFHFNFYVIKKVSNLCKEDINLE